MTSAYGLKRFDADGRAVRMTTAKVSSTDQPAPVSVGKIEKGDLVWHSFVEFDDGVVILSVSTGRTNDRGEWSTNSREVFLEYPSKDAARAAGWAI